VIEIVLVDDHAVVRSGLRLLLDRQEDIKVVGEAGNAKEAIFRARALKPDVMLLDVVMPGESGIEVLPKLLKESPDTKVLVLSMQDDPSYVREAFAAGASGRRGSSGSARDRGRRPLRPPRARRAAGRG
jgi:two-component system response regulator NreC